MSLGDYWVDATFALPRDEHMPVQVRLGDGSIEKRKTVEGNWEHVTAWRKAPKKTVSGKQ